MSDDIYGDAYEAFIDEIYKNGGGEPSAVRAAVDCAIKSLRAELTAEREKAFTAMRVFERYRELEAQVAAAEAERDALRELLREARGHVGHQWDLARRIDAVLKGDGDAGGA